VSDLFGLARQEGMTPPTVSHAPKALTSTQGVGITSPIACVSTANPPNSLPKGAADNKQKTDNKLDMFIVPK